MEKFAKDEFLKEAFLGAFGENKIIFRINDDSEGYQQVLLENGCLVIQCKGDRFWANIDQIRNTKIEEIIPSNGIPKSQTIPTHPFLRIVTRITKEYP